MTAFTLLSSCSLISYSQVLPFAKQAIIGADDIELSENFIDQSEYSFAKIKFGKSAIGILPLASIDEGKFLWVSGTNENIFTFNGKIIKTENMLFSSHFIDGVTDFRLLDDKTSEYFLELRNPNALLIQNAVIEVDKSEDLFIGGSIFRTQKYYENVTTKSFKWNFKNIYWVDLTSGRVVKSIQHIHPKNPPLEITYVYK